MIPESEQPMTLEEALWAFCEPWEVRKLFFLAKKGHSFGNRENRDRQRMSQRDWNARADRYDNLHRCLQATIVAKLQDGAFIATGYDPHLPINASCISLPIAAWGHLIMNFSDSTVFNGAAVIPGVRIAKAGVLPLERQTSPPRHVLRLVILEASKQVEVDGHHITGQAAALLTLLAREAQSSSRYVTGREIEKHIWGKDVSKLERTSRAVVRDLRDALALNADDPAARRQLVQTRRNSGWRLAPSAFDIEFVP